MKTLKIAIFALSICFTVNASAQKGKYGATPEDSINCLLNLQTYQTEYKSKNYDAALVPWRKIYELCPRASQNFYIHGMVMMRSLIKETSDATLKEGRIDTLLSLYNRRIEYFNPKDKADLLYNKAVDVQTFRPDNDKAIYEAYLEVIQNSDTPDLLVVAKGMMSARTMFEKSEMTLADFTDVYTKMSDIADRQVKAAPDDTLKSQLKAGIESAFLTTDAANCENLIKVLSERFNANKENIEVVRLIVTLLTSKECTESELYYEGVEAYNKLSPSPSASYGLARMYYSKGDKEKAAQYFKEAVDTETNVEDKSKYYQEFGTLSLKEQNINQAITYARHSIAANPRNGKAYFLLGTAYGQVKVCGDDNVSKGSVYWVAVDKLAKAKQLDPSLTAEANKSINMYSQYFPLKTDAFFLNIIEGETYTVNCGMINETTIVRPRKE